MTQSIDCANANAKLPIVRPTFFVLLARLSLRTQIYHPYLHRKRAWDLNRFCVVV